MNNDLGIKVWIEGNDLKIEMPVPVYNDLTNIFAKDGMTIEDALSEFMKWSVERPEDFKRWVKNTRKY